MTPAELARFVGTFTAISAGFAVLIWLVWPKAGEQSAYRKREIANRTSNVVPMRRIKRRAY